MKTIMADRGRRVKHTPGPWRQSFHASDEYEPLDDSGSYTIVRSGSTEGQPIALMWNGDAEEYGVVFKEEAKANATLMAAAPELLDALTSLLDRYTALVNCGDCGTWNPEDEAELKQARAAIAKAEASTDEDEVANLKHDIERYVQINAELATENEKLRASLGAVVDLHSADDDTLRRRNEALFEASSSADLTERGTLLPEWNDLPEHVRGALCDEGEFMEHAPGPDTAHAIYTKLRAALHTPNGAKAGEPEALK